MKHVIISDYGKTLGVTSERLLIRDRESTDQSIKEIPLRKINTISVHKQGVSLSSNLLTACANYGIKVFIGNHAKNLCCLYGNAQHGVVQNRINQFMFLQEDDQRHRLACTFVYGKLRNQRATALYFSKQHCSIEKKTAIANLAHELDRLSKQVINLPHTPDWLPKLMGFEGIGAKYYWQALRKDHWLGDAFSGRKGRGASDSANQALNYGYGILSSVIWNTLANAGLEVYLGALHVIRAGRPALVLDLMEEFRPWVVDRAVIKLRKQLNDQSLIPKTRKQLTATILSSLEKPIPYQGKKVRLESVIQRQCYRLCGLFAGQKKYKPVLFRW